ncbi:MAG: hypothetical protein IKQ28_07825, partial [Lachnospiraceae bacterium]|nr:hypothetical protein [Lachnospiraceae bacterium]
MPEWLRNIFNRIKEWWLKFTTRQKMIIIFLTIVAIITFIVILTVVTRPKFTTIRVSETTKESNEVTTILEDAGIEYRISSNALVISV